MDAVPGGLRPAGRSFFPDVVDVASPFTSSTRASGAARGASRHGGGIGRPAVPAARALLGGRAAALGITIAYFGNVYLMLGASSSISTSRCGLPAFFPTGLWLIEVRHEPRWGSRCSRPPCSIKEDVLIYVATLALYFAVTGQRRVAMNLGLGSVIYGAFVALVGFPALVGGASPPIRPLVLARLRGTISELLGYFLTHPGRRAGLLDAGPPAGRGDLRLSAASLTGDAARHGSRPVCQLHRLPPPAEPLALLRGSRSCHFFAWSTIWALHRDPGGDRSVSSSISSSPSSC